MVTSRNPQQGVVGNQRVSYKGDDTMSESVMSENGFKALKDAGFDRIPGFENMYGWRAFTGKDGTVEIVRSEPGKWYAWVILHNSEGEGRKVYMLANLTKFANARQIALYYVNSPVYDRVQMLVKSREQEVSRYTGKVVNV